LIHISDQEPPAGNALLLLAAANEEGYSGADEEDGESAYDAAGYGAGVGITVA
jgi:hypothetical protein